MSKSAHTTVRTLLTAAAFAAVALMTTDAFAQTSAQPGENNCTGAPSSTGTNANPNHGSASLTERLDNCNGVLVPPARGDGHMVAPAPQQGETPVIKPDEIAPKANPG